MSCARFTTGKREILIAKPERPPDNYVSITWELPGYICGPDVIPCRYCGELADRLCDAPMGKGQTCDIPLCGGCAKNIGEELDLCRVHAALAL